MDEMWDPNTWELEDHEYRVYGGMAGCSDVGNAVIFALVDEVDYHWAIQWRWFVKQSRGKSKGQPKYYIFRAVHPEGQPKSAYSWFLHVEIMKRVEPKPPSDHHTIADHRDGNSLNCRRSNLRWATPSMNAKNKHGSHSHEIFDKPAKSRTRKPVRRKVKKLRGRVPAKGKAQAVRPRVHKRLAKAG